MYMCQKPPVTFERKEYDMKQTVGGTDRCCGAGNINSLPMALKCWSEKRDFCLKLWIRIKSATVDSVNLAASCTEFTVYFSDSSEQDQMAPIGAL